MWNEEQSGSQTPPLPDLTARQVGTTISGCGSATSRSVCSRPAAVFCAILWLRPRGRVPEEQAARTVEPSTPPLTVAALPPPGPEPTPAPGEISVLTLLHEMVDLDNHLAQKLPGARFAGIGQAA